MLSLPTQEVSVHHACSEGTLADLTGGSHIGTTAKVVARDIKRSSKANEVQFENFGTIADYVFIIGSQKDLPLEESARVRAQIPCCR